MNGVFGGLEKVGFWCLEAEAMACRERERGDTVQRDKKKRVGNILGINDISFFPINTVTLTVDFGV